MIKIHKQLWYIVAPDREDNLAYMTYYEDNAQFEKRKSTGTDWARPRGTRWNPETRGYDKIEVEQPVGKIIDNTPVKGIYIGSSVSRWSTSNKLFRVKDPRGFTVEVPTDNIATLLHLTTVKNGVIQEECVWGRDASNHILLPVNSEPYLETLEKMDIVENKLISIKDLKVGDWVKRFEDNREYCYMGKAKAKWKIKPYTRRGYRYDYRNEDIQYGVPFEVEDTKYIHLFLYKGDYKGEIYYGQEADLKKIVEVVKNEPIENLKEIRYWSVPERVNNSLGIVYDYYSYYNYELLGYTQKDGKFIAMEKKEET